jgi:uncharacterized DUF497 family protein
MELKFMWDEVKNRRNIEKHGLDFIDARELFTGVNPFLVNLESRQEYGEDRWKGIGILKGVVVAVVVFAERGGETVRIISLRKASNAERAAYEEEIKNRLG